MHLVNFPKIRIQEYPRGFVVEIQHKNLFGEKYWKHIISVSGISNQPWYFSSKDIAIEEAKKLFGWDLIIGTAENSQN